MAKVQETRSGAGVSSDSDLSGALQGAGHQAVRYLPGGDESRARAGGASPAAERGGDGTGGERMSGGNRSTQVPDRTAAKTARRKKLFLTAFERKMCDVTAASKACGMSRFQVYTWRKADPAFEAEFIEMTERDLDYTESQLKKNIRAGKEASIFFHLKCKGKKRGWVERQEVTGADGVPLHGGVSEEEERRLRSLPLDDLKRIRDIITAGAVPAAAAAPDRQADRGEEPTQVH
jgi:hypothetical protein